jgi:hypothetical protein
VIISRHAGEGLPKDRYAEEMSRLGRRRGFVKVLPGELGGGGSFADSQGDPLDGVVAGHNESMVVAPDYVGEPAGVGFGADEDEWRRRGQGFIRARYCCRG